MKLTACALVACMWLCVSANDQVFKLPTLPYTYDALENWIDTATMTTHHTKHHQAAVNNLNNAVTQAPKIQSYTLTQLVQRVGSLGVPANISRAVRNNAGSHFNHAMFWLTMRPSWYAFDPSRPKNTPSAELAHAINAAFGSETAFKTQFTEAASKLFGSGWTWLCYKNGNLAITSTPNQDNPLMKQYVSSLDQCTPILGIDVWEHAYYLKHRNVRADYIAAWWNVVNWPRVSQNYEFAKKGAVQLLWV